jgi:hypothetical protein
LVFLIKNIIDLSRESKTLKAPKGKKQKRNLRTLQRILLEKNNFPKSKSPYFEGEKKG